MMSEKSQRIKLKQSTLEDSDEESNQLDLSQLRKPIVTSVTGFEEIIKAYGEGTEELKKLLSKECDLIYECKVCRNIFRSLANFISHKRVYCRNRFNTNEHFHFRNNNYVDQDVSTIIQAEQEINNNPYPSSVMSNNSDSRSDDKTKDLSSIVERLLRRQHQSGSSKLTDFYDQVHSTSSQQMDEATSRSRTLKLDKVGTSNVAVYQTIQHEHESNDIKVEVNEVHNMLKKRNLVLGPDGKILNLFAGAAASAENDTLDRSTGEDFVCALCKLQFETEKTLKLHLEMKHIPSTYVYQCPACSQTFSQPAAVYRHLSNDHKKSNRRIRLMRDNIIKKRVRADEVVVKSTGNRELIKLQSSLDQLDENTVWENDLSGEFQASNTCKNCLKKFDRKAVYTSHIASCVEKGKAKAKRAKATCTKTSKDLQKPPKLLELDENSNLSETSRDWKAGVKDDDELVIQSNLHKKLQIGTVDENDSENSILVKAEPKENKRKRKRTNRINADTSKTHEEEVDWNLDAEEERMKLKLECVKKENVEKDYKLASYKTMHIKQEAVEQEPNEPEDESADESGLVIDEKGDDNQENVINNSNNSETGGEQKCIICEKTFNDDEKLKYHMAFYHQRQKRFKCSMCTYHGYRRKDTMNHLKTVHDLTVDKESMNKHVSVVTRIVDESQLQKSLMRNQKLRLKKLQLQQENAAEPNAELAEKVELAAKKIKMSLDNDLLTSPPKKKRKKKSDVESPKKIVEPKTEVKIEPISVVEKIIKMEPVIIPKEEVEPDTENDVEKVVRKRGRPPRRDSDAFRLAKIHNFGKVVKNLPQPEPKEWKDSKDLDPSEERPKRNRVKPVNKDFVYDLSGLMHPNEVYEEIAAMLSPPRRESRRRNSVVRYSDSSSVFKPSTDELLDFDLHGPFGVSSEDMALDLPADKDDEDMPLINFSHPSRQARRLNSSTSLSSSTSAEQTKKVEKVADKVMLAPKVSDSILKKIFTESTSSKVHQGASEPVLTAGTKMALAAVSAGRASLFEPKYLSSISFEPVKPQMSLLHKTTPSAASSILERYFGQRAKPASVEESTAEKLCEKFQSFNVNSLSSPRDVADDSSEVNLCVLATSDTSSESESESEVEPSQSTDTSPKKEDIVEEKAPAPEKKILTKKIRKRAFIQKDINRKPGDKKRFPRLTVLQRLQENKNRRSREQLLKEMKRRLASNAKPATSSRKIFNEL